MTVVLAFVLLSIVVAAMSVGILLGRKPIAGSCGGVAAALGEKNYSCDICGGNPQYCEEQQQVKTKKHLAYEVTCDVTHKPKGNPKKI